jgi:SNF2 family DNA or RNA helicase
MFSRNDLHDYQEKGCAFVKQNKRCGLFMQMGLGKTATTLTAISDLLDSFAINKVLVIAPLRVATTVWKDEVKEWAHLKHLKVSVVTGNEKKRMIALQTPADIYTINRENVPWLVLQYKKKWSFDCVIIDESSSFKNPSTVRFKALKRILPYTEYLILLTGTPSPNSLIDLWSQCYLVDFGNALGRTFTGFKDRFFEQDYNGFGYKLREGQDKIIQSLIKPFVLSMETKDYLELPETIILNQKIDLPEKVLDQYLELEKNLFLQLPENEEIDVINAGVLANKLLQFANGFLYKDEMKNVHNLHDEKLNALEELIECNDEPMLVAYNFKADLERLIKRFPFARVLDKKPETIESWNKREIKLMLAHPASAGHGINLQKGGSFAVWYSLTWSLENYLQFNKRLDRQGQTQRVRIVHLISKNTIDERILRVLETKDFVQQNLMQALKPDYL